MKVRVKNESDRGVENESESEREMEMAGEYSSAKSVRSKREENRKQRHTVLITCD